jgi:transcriptional regulator with PAS, ATPase and Fis domain
MIYSGKPNKVKVNHPFEEVAQTRCHKKEPPPEIMDQLDTHLNLFGDSFATAAKELKIPRSTLQRWWKKWTNS